MRKKRRRANRKYKDRLFLKVFEKKEDILSLYNAVNDSNYEHQSTFNPNMPLRDCLYMLQLLQEYIDSRKLDLYSSVLLKIPTPRLVVFYNGQKKMEEEEKILKLSDSFERQEKEPAIEEAIRDCLNCGFLTELLTKYRQEVIGMLLTEYDEKRHLKNTYEQGRADGWADGNKEGLRQGIRKGIERERYRTAHNLYLRGFTPQDAAIILEEDEKTVTSWFRKWKLRSKE